MNEFVDLFCYFLFLFKANPFYFVKHYTMCEFLKLNYKDVYNETISLNDNIENIFGSEAKELFSKFRKMYSKLWWEEKDKRNNLKSLQQIEFYKYEEYISKEIKTLGIVYETLPKYLLDIIMKNELKFKNFYHYIKVNCL